MMQLTQAEPLPVPSVLFSALPDAACRLDATGVIREFNQAAGLEWGAAHGHLAGLRLVDLMGPGGPPLDSALQQARHEQGVVTTEFENSLAGQPRHQEARVVPLPQGEMLVLIRDITARKLAETSLRERDAQFRHLAENVTDALWIRSADMQQVHYVSPAFERIWGRPMQVLYGDPARWIEFVIESDRDRVGRAFAELTVDAPSLDVEYRITRGDGELRWVRVRGFQVRDGTGRLIRVTGIVTDITERKQAQEALEAAQRQLIHASRRAGMAEIASNVLHNVGNILNSVTVSAGLLHASLDRSRLAGLVQTVRRLDEHAVRPGESPGSDETARLLPGYLQELVPVLAQEQRSMAAELDNLCRSIDHIREVVASQQSHAARQAVIEPILISELMEDALRINGEALQRDHVSVVRNFAPLPAARLDRALVLQILVNLIGNARDALAGTPSQARCITLVTAAPDPARLRVLVHDAGEGIAPDDMTRIFLHGYTTRPHGHGFGLHSCALAATQMGGTLKAHSEGRGRGATFTLELPFEPVLAKT